MNHVFGFQSLIIQEPEKIRLLQFYFAISSEDGKQSEGPGWDENLEVDLSEQLEQPPTTEKQMFRPPGIRSLCVRIQNYLCIEEMTGWELLQLNEKKNECQGYEKQSHP